MSSRIISVDPFDMVVFGATGDLAARKLMPALFRRDVAGQIPTEARIIGVKFGSRAKRAGFEQGWKVSTVKVPADRPSQHWIYLPALALVGLVFFLQRIRMRRMSPVAQ